MVQETMKTKTYSDDELLEKMNQNDLSMIEKITEIIVKNKLDSIKFGEIEIKKSIHAADPVPPPKPKTAEEIQKEAEDLLFHSGAF